MTKKQKTSIRIQSYARIYKTSQSLSLYITNFHSFVATISGHPKPDFFVFSSLLVFPPEKSLVWRCFSINSNVILKNSRALALIF